MLNAVDFTGSCCGVRAIIVKHYIDTHKEENCHEPVVGGHIIITRFQSGAMLGWMKDKPKMLMCDNSRIKVCWPAD